MRTLIAIMLIVIFPQTISAKEPMPPKPKPQIKMEPKAYARQQLVSRGHARIQFECLNTLWTYESNWNPKSKNKHSTARGIAQMLNEKSSDPFKQIDHGIKYIEARYSTPCMALKFWKHKQKITGVGWY